MSADIETLTDKELSSLAWKLRGWTDDDHGPLLYPREVALAVIRFATVDRLAGCRCYEPVWSFGYHLNGDCPACSPQHRWNFRRILPTSCLTFLENESLAIMHRVFCRLMPVL